MMKSVLDIHLERIHNLDDYFCILSKIDSLTNEKKRELNTEFSDYIRFTNRRRYDYEFAIVNLYGVLESFIEKIAIAYLQLYTKLFESYDLLPKKITENHMRLSTQLLANKSSKYEKIRKEQIIQNLDSCVNKNKPFIINFDAFTQHTANFRKDIICQFFSELCVDNIALHLKNDAEFKELILNKNNITVDELSKVQNSDGIYFNILEDLIERRNCISHGELSDDLLSPEIIISYAKYIHCLIVAIHNVLNNEYVNEKFLTIKTDMVELKPINIYNNNILCFKNSGVSFKKNDVMFSFSEDTQKAKQHTVLNIQVNNIDIEEITEDMPCNIGVLVEPKIKATYKFYMLKK